MRAAIFRENGGPEVLRVEYVPTPEPGPGEVRIAVRAAAMNHLDLFVRRGLPGIPLPHIGGSDIAGVVDAAGPGVTGAVPGMRVVVDPTVSCGVCEMCRAGEESLCDEFRILGEHLPGGFAEYVTVPAVNLLEIPDGFDWDAAAAAPLTFLTAWRGLVSRGRLRAGERVLITGASGGVSTAAIQIARHLRAEVHAITTAGCVERVRALGAEHVWDRGQPDHRKRAFEATGRNGFALILDSVGEATWHENIRALSRAGRLVVYGATTGARATTDLRYLFWKQVDILGTTMSNRREFETVMRLVLAGELRPVIDRVFPLAEIAAAHSRLEAGDQFGKIVIRPEPRG
jgi:NADPH:quinone reductase-like Zn-dependent oxidoreductase